MLKVHYQKLRLKCKGSLNAIFNSSRINKRILNSIPVLSIFVLLGIMIYNVVLFNSSFLFGLGETSHEAYADETIGDNTASIVIGGSGKNEQVAAGRNSTAYRSHTITVKGSNVRDYALNIYGDSNLRYVNGNDVLTSANGAQGGNIPANTWGYAFGDSTSDNSTLSYTAPTSSAVTLLSNTVSATNNTSTNSFNVSNNKLVFAARFDQDKPTGSYQASVTLALTVTPRVLTTYTVLYNGNNNTSGTVPSTQTISLYDTDSYEFTVAANSGNLARTGYTFLGWSEDPNATTATYTAGSSKVSLTSASPSKTLYAVWEKAIPTWDNITKMQDMTAAICKSAAIGAEKTLIDSGRGNTQYTIRKLADGNCWMVDNLKLDLSSYTLTSENSDVTSNYTAGTATNVTAINNWSSRPIDNKAQFNINGFGNSSYKAEYGYYYSWYAATAGTGTFSMDSGDAPSSICPKGWKLPKGNPDGDFQALYNKWTTATWTTINSMNGSWFGASTASAGGAFFPAAGCTASSGLFGTDLQGYYWSRTVGSSRSYAGFLNFAISGVNPTSNAEKTYGLPIRCIAYSS